MCRPRSRDGCPSRQPRVQAKQSQCGRRSQHRCTQRSCAAASVAQFRALRLPPSRTQCRGPAQPLTHHAAVTIAVGRMRIIARHRLSHHEPLSVRTPAGARSAVPLAGVAKGILSIAPLSLCDAPRRRPASLNDELCRQFSTLFFSLVSTSFPARLPSKGRLRAAIA
jgi:hypothetical protein